MKKLLRSIKPKKVKRLITNNKTELTCLLIILLVGFVLRFYRITKLDFFTYDQARDAIYVKRLVADGIPRLLGTQTSLPGMYLPPFYYYTIAPILWIGKLNPISIDIYSASIGILTVILVYWVANRLFGQPAGIVAAAVYSISPLSVELSRRAWNPNTLPFFILASFYFLDRFWRKRNGRDLLVAIAIYGYCLSLHFGAWTLIPIFFSAWLFYALKKGDKKILFGSVLITVFFIFPLILF